MIYGRRPVEEALRASYPLKKIYLAKGLQKAFLDKIFRLAKPRKIACVIIERRELERFLPGKNIQGILALTEPFCYSSLEYILKRAEEKEEDAFVLVLDHLQDSHNLGAILRTAEVAGLHGVIIPKRRAAQVTSSVFKISAGAAGYLPIARVANIVSTLKKLKKEGLWVAGADLTGESIYNCRNLRGPLAIVIGGEGEGISRLVREKCDILLYLPMLGRTESLNASVAGGILLYEILRQRKGW